MVQMLSVRESFKKGYPKVDKALSPFFTSFLFFSTMTNVALAQEQLTAKDDDYIFNPDLFKGSNFDLSALEAVSKRGAVAEGTYKLDVYVNNTLLGNYDVTYSKNGDKIQPCFSDELINDIGFKERKKQEIKTSCTFLDEVTSNYSVSNELSSLKLKLTIPQAALVKRPPDYVNPDNFQTGTTVGFFNYSSNIYHVNYSDTTNQKLDSVWLSLTGGINFATWQYRQMSSVNWSKEDGYQWKNVRRYVQRPIVSMNSQFMAGQLITNGSFFSGMSYNGINLATSEAMLPQSQRGYAPVIRGVATSNARVTVRQNGIDIYQTTVPPGAFELTDLYPTSQSGDLSVQVAEADGTIRSFVVPFSALPESVRPGFSKYNIAIGRVRDTEVSSNFGDFIYQRGLTNSVTANTGLRVANKYLATNIGIVYGSNFGAVGIDATYSHAKLNDNSITEGWMAHTSWSKTFNQTGTTLSLASYRYSSSGYRDLISILGQNSRSFSLSGTEWLNYTESQLQRFDLSLSQSLGDFGNSYISAATQSYRGNRSNDTQLQFGYNKTIFGNLNMNLAVTRQRVGTTFNDGTVENSATVSFSLPIFSEKSNPVSLTTTYNHSNTSGDQYQVGASGMLDAAQTISYNINGTHDQSNNQNIISGGMQKRLPKVTLGGTVSKGKDYWQASGNAQGAVVVHSGGVTLGPYLGDTFALVEAKGAEGASIFTSSQSKIDSNGYAIIPSLTPYRYNSISLDPEGMDGDVEILDSQKRIAPVAGSSVKIKFNTRTGTALLITALTEHDQLIPMGSQVYNEKGEPVGMAGQNGQVYVRVDKPSGHMTIKWNDDKEKCILSYQIPDDQFKSDLVNITSHCRTE